MSKVSCRQEDLPKILQTLVVELDTVHSWAESYLFLRGWWYSWQE
jgi:hypothetical protein